MNTRKSRRVVGLGSWIYIALQLYQNLIMYMPSMHIFVHVSCSRIPYHDIMLNLLKNSLKCGSVSIFTIRIKVESLNFHFLYTKLYARRWWWDITIPITSHLLSEGKWKGRTSRKKRRGSFKKRHFSGELPKVDGRKYSHEKEKLLPIKSERKILRSRIVWTILHVFHGSFTSTSTSQIMRNVYYLP